MAMSSNLRNWSVFVGAMILTGSTSLVYIHFASSGDGAIRQALRSSAHAAFLLLLLVFVARPLRQMVRTPLTLSLLKNRRLLGIAFAGIHTAHLGLLVLRDRQVADFDFVPLQNIPGALVYVAIFLMFLTSFDSTARALGPRHWKLLHKVGLYWIFVAFLPTLLPETREQLLGPNGVLVLLAAIAIVIRLTAFLAIRAQRQ